MFGRRRVYLDAAAGMEGNPSSPHEEGRRAKARLEAARRRIARILEVRPGDVVFTGGATEANALAILGAFRAARTRGVAHPHLLYLPSAHASIVENMRHAEREGARIETLPVRDFRVDVAALASRIGEDTTLVSMDAVCGETGVIWNTHEVASALATIGQRSTARVLLHVDASQAPRSEKTTRAHFAADLLTLDASKVGSVRGIGALVAGQALSLAPLYGGGGQERRLRPGSEAVELVERFASALEETVAQRETFRAAAEKLRVGFLERILRTIPQVYVTEGHGAGLTAGRQAPHIINISLPGRDTDYLVALLDEAGFAVSTRSACETDSETGSRAVLRYTGDEAKARSTLRVSWGPGVTARALERFARALERAVTFIDTSG